MSTDLEEHLLRFNARFEAMELAQKTFRDDIMRDVRELVARVSAVEESMDAKLEVIEERLEEAEKEIELISDLKKDLMDDIRAREKQQQNMLVPENRDIIKVISVVPFDPGINVSVHSLRSYRARFLFSSYLFAIRFPDKDCRVCDNEKYPIDFLRIPWPPPRSQCRIRSIEFNPSRLDSAG